MIFLVVVVCVVALSVAIGIYRARWVLLLDGKPCGWAWPWAQRLVVPKLDATWHRFESVRSGGRHIVLVARMMPPRRVEIDGVLRQNVRDPFGLIVEGTRDGVNFFVTLRRIPGKFQAAPLVPQRGNAGFAVLDAGSSPDGIAMIQTTPREGSEPD